MTYPPQNPPGNGWQQPGQPYPGQPQPGWQQPGQPYPGQPQPGQPQPGWQQPGQQWPGQQQPGGPKKSPLPWIIGGVAAALVLCVILAVGVFAFSGNGDKEKEETSEQASSSFSTSSSSSSSSSRSTSTSTPTTTSAPHTIIFKVWTSEPVPSSFGHFRLKVWQNGKELKSSGTPISNSDLPYEKTVTLSESDRADPKIGIGLVFFGDNGHRANPSDSRTWNCELIADGVSIDTESAPLGNSMSSSDIGISCEFGRRKK